METKYQVETWSMARAQWVFLKECDSKDEALQYIRGQSKGTYRITEVFVRP